MRKVLYVEDDPINAMVMEKLLGYDFAVTRVADGEACLEIIQKEDFDIILMDVHLGKGKIDGTKVLKEVKADPRYKDVRVIAITSYALPEDEDRFLNDGFDDYFAKPVDFHKLIERLNQYLES